MQMSRIKIKNKSAKVIGEGNLTLIYVSDYKNCGGIKSMVSLNSKNVLP